MSQSPRILSLTLSNGDGFAQAPLEADYVVISFSRREVEAGLIGDAVDRLMHLSDTRAVVEHYADSVAFEFTGYDDDPREIFEVPEIRAFFAAVNAQWALWWHFLDTEGPLLKTVLFLLAPVTRTSVQGQSGFQVDGETTSVLTLQLFDAMNALYEHHGLGREANLSMSDKVIATIARDLR